MKGAAEATVKAYAALWSKGVLEKCSCVPAETALVFETESGASYTAQTPEREERPKAKQIENINLHEHELIGYDTYRGIIEELKEVPGGISVADKASGESAERGDQCKTPCKRGCLNECIIYAAEETFNRRCLQRAAG